MLEHTGPCEENFLTSHHPLLRLGMIVSKLGRFISHLQFHHYVNHRQLYGTSRLPLPSKVISWKLILSLSMKVQKMFFTSRKALERYLWDGRLYTVDATGKLIILSLDKYQNLSSLDIYTIVMVYHSLLKNIQQYL
jgi:hypothetical protein